MKKLFFVLMILLAVSCSKNATTAVNPPAPASFFKDNNAATSLIKRTIQDLQLDHEFVSVDRISYFRAGIKDYALVFYSSTKGSKSLVVKKSVGDQLADQGVEVSVCTGSCDCKVRVIFYNDGSVDVGCSCGTCKMTTTYGSIEQPRE